MLYFGCLFYFREVLFLMEEYIVFERVSKSYTVGDLKIDAVSEASFSAAKGGIHGDRRRKRRGKNNRPQYAGRNGPLLLRKNIPGRL